MSKIGNSPLSVSQNFLTSAWVIDCALRRTSLKKQDQVVEIGAGKGHLTKKLGETCGLVWALELDSGLCQKLRTKFADSPNIRVVCCDFLKWPLPRTPYRIFANIPFNRTTEILRRVTQAEHPPEEAWLVVEKGAAKRLLGQPAESTLSLLTKPLFQCDICYSFRREDFHPAPSVDAVLLHLRRKQVPDVPSEQMPQYRRFVTGCFQKQGYGLARRLTKRQISTALRLAHLPAALSEREMKYVQWLCLFRCYLQYGKK
nr:rR adenine N-6-methyltransferase [uncultured bacterium]